MHYAFLISNGMKINLKFTNLDPSPAIAEYVRSKFSSLDKLVEKFDAEGAVLADVEIARTTKHHHKGPVFRAEINLQLPKKIIRAEHEDWDVRVAIDQMRHKLQREIVKYKETHA